MSNIPVKLLNEAQGHVVSLELTTGETYRGKLVESEDNMNVQLRDVTVTGTDSQMTRMDHVFVRGSHVRFFVVPDMLENAPLFKTGPQWRPSPPIRGPRKR
ncbi:SMD3 (YLR147C) [Zygosaccharomyces parabailii]|uniref:Small nuclear ribonucleoprotein Sm D3 n=1 Tax=Zygosaccharomyces bailii (strain CLIB 213 / ATCC 58445 / CBS 680 / BCRC 21525 / NBRC 1098 / NCYC 1416 / NRRL Y-2227) TaxID=1333698 RepID=A0A8J2T580_ZYGB2|nr:SMD3 (YLR147C) [Zygosaccharomyces parabailii]CDF89237.1 ZYBA0S03-12442g1_1 [Zygosaccharomyces bailii CLIB 213]CDH16332.1 probable Small nuclear ribonucleoprotein Sm D3 [Zygosaccharomyces bailii ISA1307]SJM87914.1 probable Small nuclear ribonucleoprotein Sm D3 [Zygosaccharomyces bailii]